ncbi:hypothetical protein HYU11_05870 [Candidatus Woesearchaeota archaeon]|nr:hypothetical protein [Candidatus Woesearchaeota archaeon]
MLALTLNQKQASGIVGLLEGLIARSQINFTYVSPALVDGAPDEDALRRAYNSFTSSMNGHRHITVRVDCDQAALLLFILCKELSKAMPVVDAGLRNLPTFKDEYFARYQAVIDLYSPICSRLRDFLAVPGYKQKN